MVIHLALSTVMLINFEIWISCGNVDIFVIVINFLNDIWVPMHVIVGLFEVNETIGESMVVQL